MDKLKIQDRLLQIAKLETVLKSPESILSFDKDQVKYHLDLAIKERNRFAWDDPSGILFDHFHLEDFAKTYHLPDSENDLFNNLAKLDNVISMLERIYNSNNEIQDQTIIDKNHLELILKRFKEFFPDEKNEIWLRRFLVYPSEIKFDPIKIEAEVKGKNDRLILLIILSAIQLSKQANFDFDSFVFERFGIKNYQKAKTDHKDKIKNSEELKICNKILMT